VLKNEKNKPILIQQFVQHVQGAAHSLARCALMQGNTVFFI